MKKILAITFLWVICNSNNLVAGGVPYDQIDGYFQVQWTPIQLTLGPTVQLFHSKVPVYGMSLGSTASLQEKVVGLHIAPFSGTRKLFGFSASLVHFFDYNYGFSLGLFNIYRDFSVLSIGVVNFSKNHISFSGVDVGVLNIGENGVDLGIVNLGDNNVQVGLVNVASYGWQFGLINYNKNSFFPYMILFNFGKK